LKPDGWGFSNPAAPAFPTASQVTRWGLNANLPLTPDMGAYWEVTLSQANFDRLAQMDVIYIPISRNGRGAAAPTFFTEEQRRILARLADSGVAIWIDWALPAATVSGALGGNEAA